MAVNINDLYTKTSVRFRVRLCKHGTIILSTGKKINFEKKSGSVTCSYENYLIQKEKQEYNDAVKMLLGESTSARIY